MRTINSGDEDEEDGDRDFGELVERTGKRMYVIDCDEGHK